MKLSVVMSVYNGDKFLNEAIDSILEQTFKDFEFIIVNDGSTDNSLKIINSYKDERIKLINQENKGLAAALNCGINKAQGEYIARLDADDIALPERFEKQLSFLEKNKNCILVGSNAIVIDKDASYLFNSNQLLTNEDIVKQLDFSSPFFHSSVIFKKEIFEKCGGYYEKIKHHFEDFILWNKMKYFGELCNIEKPLIKYRITPFAITNRKKKSTKIMVTIARKILSNGEVSEDDLIKLKKITHKKSKLYSYSKYYTGIGVFHLYKNNNRKKALINFIKGVIYHPFIPGAWFFLILGIQPLFIIKRWKKIRKIS